MAYYWTTDDLRAGLCRSDDLGRAKPLEDVEVVQLESTTYTNQQLVEIAMRALVQAAQQRQDPTAAVRAANSLLDRVLGPVMPPPRPVGQPAGPQQGALPPPPDNSDLLALIMAGRFGYQDRAPDAQPQIAVPSDAT